MRLVLDTNVVLSGLLWKGVPGRLLFTEDKDVQLFTSVPLIQELTGILSRSKFHMKLSASSLSVSDLIDAYVELTEVVIPVRTPRLAPDPDDDVVIGTALAANANFLVTGDNGLLSVQSFDGGRIVSVREALQSCDL